MIKYVEMTVLFFLCVCGFVLFIDHSEIIILIFFVLFFLDGSSLKQAEARKQKQSFYYP